MEDMENYEKRLFEEKNRRDERRRISSEKRDRLEVLLFDFVESTIKEPHSDAAIAALPEVAKILYKMTYPQ